MTVVPILWNYADKNGGRKLYIRITTGDSLAYFDTGYKIVKSNWNKRSGKVINLPNADDINSDITIMIGKAEIFHAKTKAPADEVKAYLESGDDITQGPDFFTFVDDYLKDVPNVGYRDAMRSALNKFLAFNEGKKLLFDDITPTLLRKYEMWLYGPQANNSDSTAHRALGQIRTICNKAVELGVIKNSPFKYKLPKYKRPKIMPLTREEFMQIANLDTSKMGRSAKDCYYIQLFGMLTGWRISERLMLKWENIHGNEGERWIEMISKKTGEPLRIRVNERIQKILDVYKGRSEKYVFPFIEKDSTPELLHQELKTCTARINFNLKRLAKRMNLGKRLSTHIARHTFTNEFMNIHKSSSLAAQVLQIDEKTLSNYWKQFPSEVVDDARDAVFQ